MGSGSSIRCLECTKPSYGRCDFCNYRYCLSHFRKHGCAANVGYKAMVVRCTPKCSSCYKDAVGDCQGCGVNICPPCFYSRHERRCF
ncbi:unnamed protein product [Adineta ricciae]|uniref:Uncharacterized protein n=1 Tax=Adineta ricciae TaxID=249248 RepID=A0A814AI19_ADIRI|nr:unnamed protein product [Adineta ricciae]CAF1216255.1 unnamed protein product [Adineta ricciae]